MHGLGFGPLFVKYSCIRATFLEHAGNFCAFVLEDKIAWYGYMMRAVQNVRCLGQ
jgi:hypothetical protein